MRKLAPMFITTSILALAAGTAFANTSDVTSTDKNGQPTVSNNTNKQPLSYSDKSSTAKGTNAKMDDKPAIAGSSNKALDENTKSYVSGEDKREVRDETKDAMDADAATAKHKPHHAKAKHVKHHKSTTTARRDDTMSSDMPTAKPSPSSDSTPMSATKGEAANSTTGKSAGQ
ncbi:MAG TPA: hypothetical protein VFP44_20990 [Usitatibacter sp.]|nr:hypothetical protein [Usitatibacter sp.]